MNLPQTAWKNGMEHLVEGVATGEVEILLVVSGFDVDWDAEAERVNMYVDMGRGDVLCELDSLAWLCL